MAFPTVFLLDSFTRAAESPLSNGGKWKALEGTLTNSFAGRISSEEYMGLTAFNAAKEDCAYWSVSQYSSPAISVEWHVLATSERWVTLWCCLKNPTLATKAGYRARFVIESIVGSEAKVKFVLERVTESVATKIGEATKVGVKTDDLLGITVSAGKVIAWHKSGAGAWTEVVAVADSTYTGGYIGVGTDGNTAGLRNFEASGQPLHEFEGVTQPQTASLSRSVKRVPAVSQAQSPSLARPATKALAAEQGQLASLGRSLTAALSASQSSTATLVRSPSRTLSTTQPQTASLTTGVEEGTRFLEASQPSTPTLRRSVSHALSSSSSSTVSLRKDLSRALGATQISSPSILRPLGVTFIIEQPQTALLEIRLLSPHEREEREEEEREREREATGVVVHRQARAAVAC